MLYRAQSSNIAHNLQYDWTGWLAGEADSSRIVVEVLQETPPLFARDKLSIKTFRIANGAIQILFDADATVSPAMLAQHVKGRLQHALHKRGHPAVFSRKVAVRSVGNNVRTTVEKCLQHQVAKAHFADPRFAEKMLRYTVTVPTTDLAVPSETAHGRYWYNVHLVLVASGRYRFVEDRDVEHIRDGALAAGHKLGCLIAAVSVMPDHLHCILRGNPQESPAETGCAFQNAIADQMRMGRIWEDRFYVGTFSEYDVGAILRRG